MPRPTPSTLRAFDVLLQLFSSPLGTLKYWDVNWFSVVPVKVLKEWDVKVKLVKTKRGAVLHMIELEPGHFYLEQNPLKDSKYGVAYRRIKENFPEFYMFWEIRNNRYTGKLLAGAFLEKSEIDEFVALLAKTEDFKKFEEILEEIEEMEE